MSAATTLAGMQGMQGVQGVQGVPDGDGVAALLSSAGAASASPSAGAAPVRSAAPDAAEAAPPPDVAVVMATYRRSDLLRRCLDALLAQTFPADRYEIIVVDDGRSDDTRAVVVEFAARTGGRPAVRYLQPHATRGPAGARNRGWRASRAPLIAFTDDDTIPTPSWLAQGWRAMAADPGLAAAGGQVLVPFEGAPTDHARMTQGLQTAEFVTANAFVRRDALVAVGGFDERFTRAWREDSDLQFSILALGRRVGRAPAACVLHPVRPAPWGISLEQQANVAFDALLYRKHRQLFLERVRRHPPWLYVGIVGGTLAVPVALAAGAPKVAAGCGVGVLAGILTFAARRLRGTAHTPSHVAEMVATSFAIPYLAAYWRAVGVWRFKALCP